MGGPKRPDRCCAALADAPFLVLGGLLAPCKVFEGEVAVAAAEADDREETKRWSRVVIMRGRLCPEQSLELNPAGRGSGEGPGEPAHRAALDPRATGFHSFRFRA